MPIVSMSLLLLSIQTLYDGITGSFGLEGTVKITSYQFPCCGQKHLLDQVAPIPIQPGLKDFQAWDSHSLSVLCLDTLTGKNFFQISNISLLSSSLKLFPCVLTLHALVTNLSIFLEISLQVLEGCPEGHPEAFS